jgi:hypothetical protein
MTKTQLEETDRVRAIFDEFGPQKRPRHGLGGPDPFSDGREWLTAGVGRGSRGRRGNGSQSSRASHRVGPRSGGSLRSTRLFVVANR